jgi:hypothetical protein
MLRVDGAGLLFDVGGTTGAGTSLGAPHGHLLLFHCNQARIIVGIPTPNPIPIPTPICTRSDCADACNDASVSEESVLVDIGNKSNCVVDDLVDDLLSVVEVLRPVGAVMNVVSVLERTAILGSVVPGTFAVVFGTRKRVTSPSEAGSNDVSNDEKWKAQMLTYTGDSLQCQKQRVDVFGSIIPTAIVLLLAVVKEIATTRTSINTGIGHVWVPVAEKMLLVVQGSSGELKVSQS